MVNILRFPGSNTADTSTRFRVDDVQTLFVDDSAMVFTSETAFPVLKRQPTSYPLNSGDWSNQELADLYRVEALLVQAGMRLETERGLTDEDDPWFVFCSQDGDVFVHLARIDGRYLLDSPGLGAPIRGDDFNALVDMFIRHQAATAPAGNVVRFRPGSGKDGIVRLHPAMMMAALIWTLYLASDHFVATAEAAESPEALQAEVDHHVFSPDVPGSDAQKLTYLNATTYSRDDAAGRSLGSDGRTAVQAGNLVGNSIAASLSTIAASWGVLDPRLGPLPELPEPQDRATVQLDLALERQSPSTGGDDPLVHISSSEHTSLIDGPLIKPEMLKEHGPELAGARASASTDVQAKLPNKITTTFEGRSDFDRIGSHRVDLEKSAADAVATNPSPVTSAERDNGPSDVQSLLKLAGLYAGETQKYTVGNISISATFDLASLGKEAAGLVLSQLPLPSGTTIEAGVKDGQLVIPGAPPAPHDDTTAGINDQPYIPPHVYAYDGDAKDFVYRFLRESPHIEMIKVDNAIIFVDTTAIDEASDVTAMRSWSLNDTTTVSTIGHADYFAKYFYQDYYLA